LKQIHMACSATQLGCQLLLPPKYTINLKYSRRCSNIHTIDELRASLRMLRCPYLSMHGDTTIAFIFLFIIHQST
jgi:hypothetical protein